MLFYHCFLTIKKGILPVSRMPREQASEPRSHISLFFRRCLAEAIGPVEELGEVVVASMSFAPRRGEIDVIAVILQRQGQDGRDGQARVAVLGTMRIRQCGATVTLFWPMK